MKILLTGFEPFGGDTTNPSAQVVEYLAQQSLMGCEIAVAILPVDRWRGPAAALSAIEMHRPDVVLSLGQATGRSAISIERVAVNLMDYRIADNVGHVAADEPIVADGPAAYFATVPVREMLAAVHQAGVPAELSLSAGTYLCNQVLYAVLHHLEQTGRRAGFIHLPMLPEQAAAQSRPTPSMGLETLLSGVQAAVSAVVKSAG